MFPAEGVPGLLSVIIPNWNGARFLPTCLDALAAQTYPHLEVIVVDNASSDASASIVQRRAPTVTWLPLPHNAGFTGACNAGLRAARGDWLVLLNNDTEVAPGWAAALVGAFARHPAAGSLACKMLLFDQRDTFHTAGDIFMTDGRAGNRGVWQRDVGQYDREEPVFSACGGSAAYRRTMLAQVGLLDDDFFFSSEDVDLGWRALLAGWRCLYIPQAVVYHHLAATGGGVTSSYYDGRNQLYVLVKNLPTALWRVHGRAIVRAQARQAWAALRAWRGAAARARLRGMMAALVGLPRMWRKRRVVQATRVVPLSVVVQALTPTTPPSDGAKS